MQQRNSETVKRDNGQVWVCINHLFSWLILFRVSKQSVPITWCLKHLKTLQIFYSWARNMGGINTRQPESLWCQQRVLPPARLKKLCWFLLTACRWDVAQVKLEGRRGLTDCFCFSGLDVEYNWNTKCGKSQGFIQSVYTEYIKAKLMNRWALFWLTDNTRLPCCFQNNLHT